MFIFGSPRSGTTWLGKLFDSDPTVAYLHEPIHKGKGLLLHETIGMLRRGEQCCENRRVEIVHELVESLPAFLQPPFFDKQSDRFPASLACAWAWQRLTGRSGRWIAQTDIRKTRQVVVKDSLEWFSMPLAVELGARSVILLRHPCGVVNSMLRGQRIGAMGKLDRDSYWQAKSDVLEKLGYGRRADLDALADDEFEALRWLVTNREVPGCRNNAQVKIVTYGQAVAETSKTVEELFAWLNLPVTAQTRDFIQNGPRRPSEWVRRLLGRKKSYYAIIPRSRRPDLAWQAELPSDSIRRVLKIVEAFPLAEFWPALQ